MTKTQQDPLDDEFASDEASHGRKVKSPAGLGCVLSTVSVCLTCGVAGSSVAAGCTNQEALATPTLPSCRKLILLDDDDDFETVGHTPGAKVPFIQYLSTHAFHTA